MKKYFLSLIVLSALFFTQTLFAQKKEYMVFLNTNPEKEELPKEKVDELQATHLENIGKLAKEGKLSVAGPFDGGGGIFVINAQNEKEVNQILQTDPAIRANRFKLEVYELKMFFGKPTLAQEPYEMVTYQFVRYDMLRNKKELETLCKSQKVIAGGFFDNGTNGFLIVNTGSLEDSEEFLVSLKVKKMEYKSWWTAKGSFGEK